MLVLTKTVIPCGYGKRVDLSNVCCDCSGPVRVMSTRGRHCRALTLTL